MKEIKTEEGSEEMILTAETTSAKNTVLDKLLLQLGTQYDQNLGPLGAGQPAKAEFTVTIKPTDKGLEAVTKTSILSYEDALAQATNNGQTRYDEEAVTASAKRTYSVPWFEIAATAREGSKGDLERALGREVSIISGRYAKQIVKDENGAPKPVKTAFKVLRYDRGVFKRGETPKGNVVAKGESAFSIEQAEAAAQAEHFKASVYEASVAFKVFGRRAVPEAPAIVTARKTGCLGALAAAGAGASYSGSGKAAYAASMEKDEDGMF